MFLIYLLIFTINFTSYSEAKPLKSMEDDMNIIIRCNKTYSVPKITLNKTLLGKQFDNAMSRELKCFLQCLYYNYEWMDNDGNFRVMEIRNGLSMSTLSDSAINNLVHICTNINNEDKCEKAVAFTQCVRLENSKLELSASDLEW